MQQDASGTAENPDDKGFFKTISLNQKVNTRFMEGKKGDTASRA